MKKVILTSVIVALSLLIIPLKNINNNLSDNVSVSAKADKVLKDEYTESQSEETFRIKTGDTVIEISAKDYITGVVSAEMSYADNIEALKAQCVAAYSFALCRKAERKNEEYDLTDSYKTDQSYLSIDALKEKWGENYEENIKKIREAVNDTYGERLVFENQTALTLYHAVSSGVTNSCADVFGSDKPYLTSVLCEEDKLSANYKSVFSFNSDELTQKLSSLTEAKPSGDSLFSDIKRAKSGFIKSINYAGKEVSGSEVARLLSLNSANFEIAFSDNSYTFTCIGHGHGVGMSQYAAGVMAQNGSDYKEILARFYPNTELKKF